jgi:hypothetical protein
MMRSPFPERKTSNEQLRFVAALLLCSHKSGFILKIDKGKLKSKKGWLCG